MHVVYLDVLFLINATANYLLLLVTARMGGFEVRRIIFLLSALLGGGYAVLPFCGVAFVEHPLLKVAMGILMSLVAFGKERRFLRATLLFFGSAAALGGTVWAVEFLLGVVLTVENGVLYSWLDIRLLFFLLILSYTFLSVIGDRIFLHKKTEIVTLEVWACGKALKIKALVDTGNTLVDAVDHSPVVVVDKRVFKIIFNVDFPLEKPVETMERLKELEVKGLRLLPYHAVGVEGGLLLGVRAEKVLIGGEKMRQALIAFSPTPLGDGENYQALIGGELWN